jgi:AcrR family transcriptional regulator
MAEVSGQRVKATRMSAPGRRKKILSAAYEVFIEQGYSGARTKEIADRAGVTEAFLYRHFASKDEMYQTAIIEPFRAGLAALAYDVETLYREYLDPIEFMTKLNERNLRFYSEFSAAQAVALYAELARGRELYKTIVRPILERIGELIADRMGWAAQGLDPTVVRRGILGAQWAVGLDLTLRRRRPNLEVIVPRMTDLFTRGVKEKSTA